MKAGDIIGAVESFAPLSLQESWDSSGLQIGSPEQEISGVTIGFDCTEDLVNDALANGCNMVVTHHPLLFGGIRRIDPSDPVGAAVVAAVRSGVVVYSAHTSADKACGGVSWAMASRLGLRNVRTLERDPDGNGLGTIGDLPEALSASEALALVKKAFNLPFVRASKPIGGPVRTVAMCGGSGASLIGTARLAGAQLYLCGDISYHHFFTPEDFMIADVGHFESEIEIVDVLHTLLKKKFPNFAVRTYASAYESANPVKYY